MALDALNFFLADVRDGLGPYLAIYLLAVHQWQPAQIGWVMTLAGLAGLVAQALLGGFLILPLRGVLYTVSDDPYWLVAIQMLDGVGAGLFGALLPLMVKDLTEGTGRFNVSLGAVTTAFGLGAALSSSLAGMVMQWPGYTAGFLTLAGVGAAAALLLWLKMPETLHRAQLTRQVECPTRPRAPQPSGH